MHPIEDITGKPGVSDSGPYGTRPVLIDLHPIVPVSITARNPRTAAPRFVAGVDGGGSGTRVRLEERGGARARGVGQAGPSALAQGVEQAWRHIGLALDAAFRDAGITRPSDGEVALGLEFG